MDDGQPLTAEEKHFEHRLAQCAAFSLGPTWRNCWPDHLKETRPLGYLSEFGPFKASLPAFIQRAEERYNGKEAVCFVENITIPWTIKLGATWDLDPNFFVSHVRPLTDAEATKTLHECRVPNAPDGLASSRGRAPWATVRGYVDHGKPKRTLTDNDLGDTTKRQHDLSMFNTRQSHTNMSFYKVNDSLHIVLIDKLPDYQPEFVLEHLSWFPNQTIVRLSMLDSPGYITVPRLGWNHLTAVFPIWTLFNDREDKKLLLRCLKDGAIDEFLYRACILQTERESLQVALDIEEINDKQAEEKGLQSDERLPNIQKVVTRLKSTIQENRSYEDKLRRASFVNPEGYPPRTEFEKLAIRFSEIDNSLVQCFYRQMTTLTAAGTKENLAQTKATTEHTKATYEQASTMTALTALAFVYVPATFVTGTFGMNVKEIDPEKTRSWEQVAIVGACLLGATVTVFLVYRKLQKCWNRGSSKAMNQRASSRVGLQWGRKGTARNGFELSSRETV